MRVSKAQNLGFCFGVKRTLQLALEAAQNQTVYTIGPLINNPQEVSRLQERGVIPLDDLSAVRPSVLLLPSHGAAPQKIAEAKALGWQILDATCPLVQKAQSLAAAAATSGADLIVFGDKNHPEIKGVVGRFLSEATPAQKAFVVANADEAEALGHFNKAVLLSQTTQIEKDLYIISKLLEHKTSDFTLHNTICKATSDRQQAALNLAKQVDVMLVIGGRSSANTQKLLKLCNKTGVPSYLVERAVEILPEMLAGAEHIGITAGASTPDWIIKEVFKKMSDEQKVNVVEEVIKDEANIVEEAAEAANQEAAEFAAPEVPETSETEDGVNLMEEAMADPYDIEIKQLHAGARVKGVIVQVKPDELLVDIGAKSEGVLPSSELIDEEAAHITEKFHVGDEINVFVVRRENKEGYPMLSKKRIDQELVWDKLAAMRENNETIEGPVVDTVRGGVLVDVGIRGFVPAALASNSYVEDLKEFVGKTLKMKILECERSRHKLVLSAKAVLREEARAKRAETWANLAEGQTIKGVVRRLTSFGAFVDIGGVDGLLHVSEMAWYRVNKPSDILKEGDEIDVMVLGVDKENEKVSLGLKQLIVNPWSVAAEKYPKDSIIQVKVMRTAGFGAFVEVEPGVEGLVHISQLAWERVAKTEDVVKPGDIIEVKVLSVDPENKRISLSRKATLEPPTAQDMPEADEVDPAPAEE